MECERVNTSSGVARGRSSSLRRADPSLPTGTRTEGASVIDAILRWSLSHRLAVLVVAGVMLVWGAYTAARMPVDVFPDLTAPTVTVITEGHGMASAHYESKVAPASALLRTHSTTGRFFGP